MMRSVCVPFLSGPASTASSFVPLTRLYVLGSFFPRCYVMINLPLGTWWPLAPQRILRTLCAILAWLAFSPTYKTGICILILLWPLSEIVSQLLPLWFQAIVWKRNCTESRRADTNWQLPILRQISLIFAILFPYCFKLCEVGGGAIWQSYWLYVFVCVYAWLSVCVHTEREREKHWSSLKTSGSISAHLFRDPEKLSSLPHMVTKWEGTIDKCCPMQLQYVCAPACLLMCFCQRRTQTRLGTRWNIKRQFSRLHFYASFKLKQQPKKWSLTLCDKIRTTVDVILLLTP